MAESDVITRNRPGRLGDSVTRPDGVEKVRGEFRFSSDLPVEGALCSLLQRQVQGEPSREGVAHFGGQRRRRPHDRWS